MRPFRATIMLLRSWKCIQSAAIANVFTSNKKMNRASQVPNKSGISRVLVFDEHENMVQKRVIYRFGSKIQLVLAMRRSETAASERRLIFLIRVSAVFTMLASGRFPLFLIQPMKFEGMGGRVQFLRNLIRQFRLESGGMG